MFRAVPLGLGNQLCCACMALCFQGGFGNRRAKMQTASECPKYVQLIGAGSVALTWSY